MRVYTHHGDISGIGAGPASDCHHPHSHTHSCPGNTHCCAHLLLRIDLLVLRNVEPTFLGQIHTYESVHMYIHIYIHIYIYTCIHIYRHMRHIHTYVDVYILVFGLDPTLTHKYTHILSLSVSLSLSPPLSIHLPSSSLPLKRLQSSK